MNASVGGLQWAKLLDRDLYTSPSGPAMAASLFDAPAPTATSIADTDEEEEILAEAGEQDQLGGDDEVEDAA